MTVKQLREEITNHADDVRMGRLECKCEVKSDPESGRMWRGDEHPQCPTHTIDGIITTFLVKLGQQGWTMRLRYNEEFQLKEDTDE